MLQADDERTVFLTSSPDASYQVDGEWVAGAFTERNAFLQRVRAVWKAPASVLLITATPDEDEKNDDMMDYFAQVFAASALPVKELRMVDARTEDELAGWLADSDVVILGGGHVPTQNAFFRRIGLRERMQDFGGIVIGISAGTMNCADVVYAQPELAGEATDPGYERFLTGLGLTTIMVLPHYQMVKDNLLDGMRLMEEVTYPDSVGRCFYALEDGSDIQIHAGKAVLRGNAYCIQDGELRQVCADGEELELTQG